MSEVLTIPTPKEFIKTKEVADRAREAEEHQRLREQEAAERQRLREEAAAPTPDRRELVRTFESAPTTLSQVALAAVRRWDAHVAVSENADDGYYAKSNSGPTAAELLAEEWEETLRIHEREARKRGSGYDDDPEDLDRVFGEYYPGFSIVTLL